VAARLGPAPSGPLRRTPDVVVGGNDLGLTRLLAIARLTPAHVVAVAADLLTALEEGDAVRIGVRPEAVRVGRDGRARLVDGAAAGEQGLAPVAALLDQLTAATSGTDPHLTPTLERAAAEARRPDGRLAIVAAIVRAADARGGARVRAELGGLVAAATGGMARPTRFEPPEPVHAPRTIVRGMLARTWKGIASVLVLAAVLLVEIAVLGEEINSDIQAALDAGRSETTATTSAPELPPVVPPAPTAAGPITWVDLRPVEPCTPDAECALRMRVLLQPRPEPQELVWDFRILDRCTGASVTATGGTVTVPPNGDRADVVDTVPLPRGEALAVMALVSWPATTASPAVAVPAAGGGCGI
jgi:hypothetical protein